MAWPCLEDRMERRIRNMEEFARVSGISRPTLSKYFQDPTSVRQSSRIKIEESLEKFDYQPNIYAVNQNRKATKNVGIVVPYLADPFFAEIVRNIESLIVAQGYRPILMSSNGDPNLEIENLSSLRMLKPAGVLLAPLGRASHQDAVRSFCDDVPTVVFDCLIEDAGRAFVGHNNQQATKLMFEYLIRTGSTPVFYEMATPANPNANKRRIAYIEAMESHDLRPMIIKVDGTGWAFEDIGYQGGLKVLRSGQLETDTVFCSNDRLAHGFLAAAYELGLRVGREPECDLRLAGHDNHPFSSFTCPKLTTISHDYQGIAELSVRKLLENIDTPHANSDHSVTLLDGELIMRASA